MKTYCRINGTILDLTCCDDGAGIIAERLRRHYIGIDISDKYLKNCKSYDVPKDRMSRPCGGAGGFDDFVERWVD